ncbi:putative quinone oxidoreductase [Thermoascus aurantiacus ATCC 26904]
MLEVIVRPGPQTEKVESPIPVPNDDQVVIKVVVSGSNPKDWKVPERLNRHVNEGDDIAGIVHQVGKNVTEFKPGDRVAAFHQMGEPGGSYAEYAVAWAHTTFHIPEKTSFEEAATIPLAAMTAAIALFQRLELPDPWTPSRTPTPLIVYGGSTAVGSYALKLAVRANIHPLIVVAGAGAHYVEKLIDRSKGDTIIDYRAGPDAVVEGIQNALRSTGHDKVEYALDAVSEKGSIETLLRVLDPHGKITFVLWYDEAAKTFPSTLQHSLTVVGAVHGQYGGTEKDKDFGYVYFRYFARGLAEGWFSGHPYEVRKDGLDGVEQALKDLKAGKASAVKYVFRIAETPALKK